MSALWLTYAWADNDDLQIDHVIRSLQAKGLTVRYDRAQLIAGRRLWEQLDTAITDPASTDGWAIYVTPNALSSEASLEELAYALDRTLRARGDFPMIGIFPAPIDRSLIPSALATRLFVNLQDPQWADRIVTAIEKRAFDHQLADVLPIHLKAHPGKGDALQLEVRPRSGRWYPCEILVREAERGLLGIAMVGPHGTPPLAGMVAMQGGDIRIDEQGAVGIRLLQAVDPLNSVFIQFKARPSVLFIGSQPNFVVVDLAKALPA